MCGIVGIFLASEKTDSRKLAAIARMTTTLQHRGPDASGTWIDTEGGIALGHRRLSIVDLSDAGKQPMRSRDKNLVMSFNGEVYNFAELRQKLENAGHHFRGHSDSEVMLAAFERFGIEASLPQFSGMFALGVWDQRVRTLHLMRDRMGKKPLYIAIVRGGIVFASELKAIQAYPDFEPRIDRNAIAMLLQHGFVPDHCCIWKGVFKLPPGSILSVTTDDLKTGSASHLHQQVRRWWQLAATVEDGQRTPLAASPSDIEAELDQLLRSAVQQRMKADVPFGVFLSGGIDSSLIAALMQAQSQRPVRSFTIGFSESDYDEAHHAAMVARHFGLEHTEFRVTPGEALAVIPDIPHVWDEPFADESQIPTLLLSRMARQHVTVALSGDGGDECFGGYTRHVTMARLKLLFKIPARLRLMTASALHMQNPEKWERWFSKLPLSENLRELLNEENLEKLARVLSVTDDCELYHRLMNFSDKDQPISFGLLECGDIPDLPDAASRIMYWDMTSYLTGDLLVKLDRATMAASLEARSPFLDHRVIDFAWRLPTTLKIRNGQGKWLLRQVLHRYLPEYLFERPKQGFNVPIASWLRGPLRNWAQGFLDIRRIRDDGFIDSRSVQSSWQEHLTGRRDRSRYLWSILMLQSWLDANRHAAPPLPALDPPDVKYPVEAES